MSGPEPFQARFQAALLSGAATPFVPAALERALAVHRNTAFSALEQALCDNFPVLEALVGEASFLGAARGYISRHPPKDPRLCFYGEHLAVFLQTYDPFLELAYLSEVADLERRCVRALFAKDALAANGSDFIRGLDPQASLQLHPAADFARYAAPVVTLWQIHQSDAPEDRLSSLAWTGQAALITRPKNELRVQAIGSGALAFAAACRRGLSLETAAAAALAAGSDLSTAFAELITAGAFLKPSLKDFPCRLAPYSPTPGLRPD